MRVERLEARLPDDGDLGAANSLAASTAVCAADAAQAGRGRPMAAQPPSAVPVSTKSRLRMIIVFCLP